MRGISIPPLILMIVMILGVDDSARANQGSFRSQCVDTGSVGPRPGDPFSALTQEYITETFSGAAASDPLGNEVKVDEIAGGALLIMVTNTGRAAKLVASLDGGALLIHKLVTHDVSGREMAQGLPLRLTEDSTLDVTRGRVNPPEAESDLRWARTGGGQTLRPLNGARLRALIAIPVVVHFMKSRDEFYRRNNVEDRFSMSGLESLLAPAGTLNTIWRQAGVFFFLHRIERCSYLIQELRPGAPAQAFENVPFPANDCLALFNTINRGYNFPAVAGLDLYIWWSIAVTGVVGYGAPHKITGNARQDGAIWLDKACIDPSVNPFGDCGHSLAHEAGHFLGLCHRCLTSTTPAASRGTCGFCLNVRDCGANDDGFLMRDDARGREVPVDDIGMARAKALERFKGSVR